MSRFDRGDVAADILYGHPHDGHDVLMTGCGGGCARVFEHGAVQRNRELQDRTDSACTEAVSLYGADARRTRSIKPEEETPVGLRCGESVVFVQVHAVGVDQLRNLPEIGSPGGNAGIGPIVVALALDGVVRLVIRLCLDPVALRFGLRVRRREFREEIQVHGVRAVGEASRQVGVVLGVRQQKPAHDVAFVQGAPVPERFRCKGSAQLVDRREDGAGRFHFWEEASRYRQRS